VTGLRAVRRGTPVEAGRGGGVPSAIGERDRRSPSFESGGGGKNPVGEGGKKEKKECTLQIGAPCPS